MTVVPAVVSKNLKSLGYVVQSWTDNKNRPKYSVSKKIDQGEFLNVAVWPGRAKQEDEVLGLQLRKSDGSWRTVSRLALYRTKDGAYPELPEKSSPPNRQEGKGDASQ